MLPLRKEEELTLDMIRFASTHGTMIDKLHYLPLELKVLCRYR